MAYKILALNLGGTSSKAAIYEDRACKAEWSVSHNKEELAEHPTSREQVLYRKELIEEFLEKNHYEVDDFDTFVMRSPPIMVKRSGTYILEGLCEQAVLNFYHPEDPPIHGNRIVYPIIQEMIRDRKDGKKVPVYLVDPPTIDEYPDYAHVLGVKGYRRNPTIHVLNQKAVARRYAEDIGRSYFDLNLIVCHLGGGVTITAHEKGMAIDSNKGNEGWGPMSPDRAGTVGTDVMLAICYDEGLTKEQAHKRVRGEAGLKGLLGTDDLREVERRIDEGDEYAETVFRAMAFQFAKEIGSCYAVLRGKVDGIIFTGGISHSKRMIDEVKSYIGTLAPVAVYAGEMENEALALGALRALTGEEPAIFLTEEESRSNFDVGI